MAVISRWTSLTTDPRTLSAISVSVHGLRPAAVRGLDRAAGLLPAERQLRALLQETPAALRAITQPKDQRLSAEQLRRQPGKGLATGGVTLPMALAELGLLDESTSSWCNPDWRATDPRCSPDYRNTST